MYILMDETNQKAVPIDVLETGAPTKGLTSSQKNLIKKTVQEEETLSDITIGVKYNYDTMKS